MMGCSSAVTAGNPELITNGDMSSGTGWTVADSSTGVSGGVATITYVSTNATISQVVTCASGATLRIMFDYVSGTGGGLAYVRIGGFSGTDLQTPGTWTTGSKSIDIAAPVVNPALFFITYATAGDSFVLDNVSVKVV